MSSLVVITPSLTQDLTVLATVKEEMGITVSTHDARLTRLIHEASADCVRYCDRGFALEEVAETFRYTSSTDTLLLSRRPVVTITSIVEDGATLTVDDYEVDAETGYLSRRDGDDLNAWATGKTVVTYSGGYVLLTNLPPDIERACIEQVKALFYGGPRDPNLRSVDVPGVMSETYWVGGVGEDDAVCPAAADRLTPHRRISV